MLVEYARVVTFFDISNSKIVAERVFSNPPVFIDTNQKLFVTSLTNRVQQLNEGTMSFDTVSN